MKIFDLDGTICESRQIISPEMKKKLLSLNETFVVISGAETKRIKKQMDGVPCIMMGQNGNDTPFWKNTLKVKEVNEIWKHLRQVGEFTGIPLDRETVQNRGCQISLSFTGHDADINWKNKFDPTKKYRNHVLDKVPFISKNLHARVAGTTCLDYNRRKCLKGDNLKRFMRLKRLFADECIYYGDNFQVGGNDASVIGVMPYVEVTGPKDLLTKL
jgi:HAD superfamily hydrolase (TIGR01484 family)